MSNRHIAITVTRDGTDLILTRDDGGTVKRIDLIEFTQKRHPDVPRATIIEAYRRLDQ